MGSVTMTQEQFLNLLCQYEQIGFMEAVKAYEPPQDLLRESEIKNWLKMMHISMKQFRKMVNIGIIKAVRKGEAKNSPWYYSKRDIKKAFAHLDVSMLLRDNNLYNVGL